MGFVTVCVHLSEILWPITFINGGFHHIFMSFPSHPMLSHSKKYALVMYADTLKVPAPVSHLKHMLTLGILQKLHMLDLV